jgi:hypothetical protein
MKVACILNHTKLSFILELIFQYYVHESIDINRLINFLFFSAYNLSSSTLHIYTVGIIILATYNIGMNQKSV